MPKADGGVRVLHALGKRGGRRPRKAPGAATLADVALVLKLEAKRDPARVGFGGGGPDALWRCLRRLRCDGSPSSRDLAGLQLDVKGCFDAIDQATLVRVAEAAVSSEAYRIHGAKRATPARAGEAAGPHKIPRTRVVSREAILAELRAHVAGHHAEVAGRFFKMVRGIPQGSVASSVLCDLYYGAFERAQLGTFQSVVACRVVDDTVAFSRDAAALRAFADAYLAEGPALGVVVHATKARTTVPHAAIPRTTTLSFCGVDVALQGGTRPSAITLAKQPRASSRRPKGPRRRLGLAAPRDANVFDRLKRSLQANATPILLDARLLDKAAAARNVRALFAAAADRAAPALAALGGGSSLPHLRRTIHRAVTFAFALYTRARRKNNLSEERPHLCLFDFHASAEAAFLASPAFRPALLRRP